MADCLREEGVVWAEERYAIQRRACGGLSRRLCRGGLVRFLELTREVIRNLLSKLPREHAVDLGMRGFREVGLRQWHVVVGSFVERPRLYVCTKLDLKDRQNYRRQGARRERRLRKKIDYGTSALFILTTSCPAIRNQRSDADVAGSEIGKASRGAPCWAAYLRQRLDSRTT